MVRCGSKNEHQKDMCVKDLLNFEGLLLSRGLAPAFYTLKYHNSQKIT